MLNKVELIGYCGREPEMRYTPNGVPTTTFSLATSNSYMKEGERHTQTEWHNIVTWNKLAETANQYISKGKRVYVEGRIQYRSWESDGQKRYRTDIVASRIIFLDKAQTQDDQRGRQETSSPLDNGGVDPDDLPF